MAIVIGNKDNFDDLIRNDFVIVDFFANWCGPCKMLSPILEQITMNKNVMIVKVDVDEEENLARRYGIMSIPTLLMFKDGKLVDTKNGFMPQPVLEKWIDENM